MTGSKPPAAAERPSTSESPVPAEKALEAPLQFRPEAAHDCRSQIFPRIFHQLTELVESRHVRIPPESRVSSKHLLYEMARDLLKTETQLMRMGQIQNNAFLEAEDRVRSGKSPWTGFKDPTEQVQRAFEEGLYACLTAIRRLPRLVSQLSGKKSASISELIAGLRRDWCDDPEILKEVQAIDDWTEHLYRIRLKAEHNQLAVEPFDLTTLHGELHFRPPWIPELKASCVEFLSDMLHRSMRLLEFVVLLSVRSRLEPGVDAGFSERFRSDQPGLTGGAISFIYPGRDPRPSHGPGAGY